MVYIIVLPNALVGIPSANSRIINLTLLDDARPIRPRTARTVENIAAVNESFAEDPGESIRRRSQQLGQSYVVSIIHFPKLNFIVTKTNSANLTNQQKQEFIKFAKICHICENYKLSIYISKL